MESWIHYLKGDATAPIGSGAKYITHICNDSGVWGAGFVLALSNRWAEPEKNYHQWYQSTENFELGAVEFVPVTADITIINMIAQKGISPENGIPPIRYDALLICLQQVADIAKKAGGSIHMPRIGCGLAGGKWNEVEKIIQKTLIANQIPTYVYDLN